MTRVAIDARLTGRRRGMGNYVYNLIAAIQGAAADVHLIAYVDGPLAEAAISRFPSIECVSFGPRNYALWEQCALPMQCINDRVDVLHCPANTAPLWLPQSVRLVITLHDVMFLAGAGEIGDAPSLYTTLGRRYRKFVVPRVARKAAAIVTVSEYSREDALARIAAPDLPITVIPEAPAIVPEIGVEALESVGPKYGISLPYVVLLGAREPRKNTKRAIEAFGRFRAKSGAPCQLLVVGLDERGRLEFEAYASGFGIGAEVLCLPYVSDRDLAALYCNASATLYPSLYEGFGLPILEAMACGSPVITSTVTCMPEVAGGAAILVDPKDTEAICDALCAVLLDDGVAQDLRSRGFMHSRQFSWSRVGEQTLRVYRSVAAR